MSAPNKTQQARELVFNEVRANVQRLSAARLKRLSRLASKLHDGLVKGVPLEERKRMLPLYDHLVDTWLVFYREQERRQLVEAERKDRGEVLFTVFFPRQYLWERQKVITRTPHRKIATRSYGPEIDVSVVRPEDWLADFQKAQVAA